MNKPLLAVALLLVASLLGVLLTVLLVVLVVLIVRAGHDWDLGNGVD